MIRGFLAACVAGGLGTSPLAAQMHVDPDSVRLVTTDIDHFWRAWDHAESAHDNAARVEVFRREYLDEGSVGLHDFLRLRIGSAEQLVATIQRIRGYYASIRASTSRVRSMEDSVRSALVRLERLYPEASFPDVYFLVGRMNSGGTVSDHGLLIGTELFARAGDAPLDGMADWMVGILQPVDRLPVVVAHEACHFNQDLPEPQTLLDKAIQEGACDFVAELVSGRTTDPKRERWAEPRERELWREFSARMDATDYRGWMYNASTAGGRPPDLGYWVGSRIVRAYYDRAADKHRALRDILRLRDYRDFLERSGYAERWQADAARP